MKQQGLLILILAILIFAQALESNIKKRRPKRTLRYSSLNRKKSSKFGRCCTSDCVKRCLKSYSSKKCTKYCKNSKKLLKKAKKIKKKLLKKNITLPKVITKTHINRSHE